ncbi:MAG: restriction endonuclease subunit S [Rhodobacteraceae bacterium]|nr:restriction endonuclease subunit S [Paracoccaceae bacterium]MCY4197632.1 restriction endonuclease subunit S [Paracoccaceae bacterium]
MTDGLQAKHRTAIVNMIRSNKRVERAVLFGSRATETFTSGSDVDIALFGDELTTADHARLVAAMDKLNVPQRVDLLLYDQVENAALRDHLRQDGIELFRKQRTHLELSEQHRLTLISLLREHLPNVEAWIYGARTKSPSHPASNPDLVVFATPEHAHQLSDLRKSLKESSLPFSLDLFVWDDLPEGFREQVERDYMVIANMSPNIGSWSSVKLGECVTMNEGTYSPKDGWPFVHYLDTGSITDNRVQSIQYLDLSKDKLPFRARRKVESGNIIFSTVRPNQRHFGLLRNIPENLLVSTGFVVIRALEKVMIPNFLYWFLTQDRIVNELHTIAEQSTSAYPSIKPSDIKSLDVALPPLSEQRAITRVLGTIDDKIDLNRRMNRTLEKIVRTIFKDWFVDFGPTRAKMADRDPYLSPELWKLFPNSLDGEDKPVGWIRGILADIADSPRRGISPSDVSENTPYIDLKHMPRRSIGLMEWEVAGKVKSHKTRFRRGDILFGKLRPYFHKVGIAPTNGICSTDIVVAVPRTCKWAMFTLACLSSDEFVNYTDRTSTGTKMPRTNWKMMAQFEVCLPPESIACAFQNIMQPLVDRICINIQEAITLSQVRDLNIPKLLSGEIRVMPESG